MFPRIWMMLTASILLKSTISELVGDHICQEEERYKVNITKYILKNITVRSYKWCVQVPPRCSTYTIQQINDTKTEEKEEIRYINKCCSGYYETEKEGICVPNSCRSCKYGQCGDSGICQCNAGYWGDNCDKECIENSWDTHCEDKCNNCIEGHCNTRTGYCLCPPKSIRCDLICSEGYENSECAQHCKCDSMTVCDPFTKHCITVNKNYTTEYDDYDYFSNYKPIKNNKPKYVRRRKYHNFSIPHNFPLVKEMSSNVTPHLTNESFGDIYKKTHAVTTEQNKNEYYKFKEKDNTTENFFDTSTTTEETIRQFRLPELRTTDIKIDNEDSTVSATLITITTVSGKNAKEIDTIHSPNLSSQGILIDSHWFAIVITGALFVVLIIMSTAVFCVLYKLKRKKRKYVNSPNEKDDTKVKDSLSSLTITTRSIFHTPLPDLPIFENPAFLVPFEGTQNKSNKTLEAHVISTMNFSNIVNHNKKSDNPETFYDHPPSTASYRPTSISEPSNRDSTKNGFDPIYDEIPCTQRIVPITSPPVSYISEPSTLYMNTK